MAGGEMVNQIVKYLNGFTLGTYKKFHQLNMPGLFQWLFCFCSIDSGQGVFSQAFCVATSL